MPAWTIALPDETTPNVTQTVSLSGRSYVLRFDWNSRTDRWTVGLSTESGTDILQGALLGMGVDLLRTIPATLSYAPPGQLWVGGMDDPTLETTNAVSLFYLEGDE